MKSIKEVFKDKDYFVIDNFLTKEEEDIIENTFSSSEFPYYMGAAQTTVDEEISKKFSNIKNVKDHSQMVHTIYDIDKKSNDTIKNSEHNKIIDILIQKILTHFDIENVVIRKAKINLQHQFTDNKPEYHDTPHIDLQQEHFVCIYYVNNSDGDTLFFDNEKDCNIIHRVSPKKGKFLFFNGKMLHTGQHPIKSWKRIVINMSFMESQC